MYTWVCKLDENHMETIQKWLFYSEIHDLISTLLVLFLSFCFNQKHCDVKVLKTLHHYIEGPEKGTSDSINK